VKVEIVSLFPDYFESVFKQSILRRAQETGLLDVSVYDLRRYTTDKHHQADDYRFGGGPGMLMLAEPLFTVLSELTEKSRERPLIIYPTPRGKPFQQRNAIELAREPHLIFICGHYKGIDERVIERWVDVQYSIGDYILTGGEPATAAIVDAVVRMIPGALGDFDSAKGDSFFQRVLDAPHYTRPEVLDGRAVPRVLTSGHHKNIERWRLAMSKFITQRKRPELLNT